MKLPDVPERQSSVMVRLLAIGVTLLALVSRRPTPHRTRGVDPAAVAAGYERSDMRPAAVVAGAIGLLVILGLVLVLVTTFEAALTGVPPLISRPSDLVSGLQAAPQPTPPAPALEAEPGQTFEAYQALEQQKLSSYRWVDRQAGIAAMPIDRAMDIIAQQGLPARAGSTPAQGSPSSASSGRVDETYP